MSETPAVMQRYIDALKAHDVDAVAGAVADEVAFVTAAATLDKAQFLAMLRALYAAFPDWHYDHDAPQVHGDVVTVRWRQHGTHTGNFILHGRAAAAATGTAVGMPAQDFFYTVRDDKIIQIRSDPIPDGAPGGILRQIGIAEPQL